MFEESYSDKPTAYTSRPVKDFNMSTYSAKMTSEGDNGTTGSYIITINIDVSTPSSLNKIKTEILMAGTLQNFALFFPDKNNRV